MSKSTKTQNNATPATPEIQNPRLLEFSEEDLKISRRDEVHVQIANLIAKDFLLLLEKHSSAILGMRGHDHEGNECRGGLSRIQQTLLGLVKGPFRPLLDVKSQKKRVEASKIREAENKAAKAAAKVAELEAQLAAIMAANKK